jgi:hypothetical protein
MKMARRKTPKKAGPLDTTSFKLIFDVGELTPTRSIAIF